MTEWIVGTICYAAGAASGLGVVGFLKPEFTQLLTSIEALHKKADALLSREKITGFTKAK